MTMDLAVRVEFGVDCFLLLTENEQIAIISTKLTLSLIQPSIKIGEKNHYLIFPTINVSQVLKFGFIL